MNKKYMPSALILYLNYFIHGIGCSILGQAVIKEALAASWGVEAMAITAISAALGLGRLIALPFAGPLSDKLGRRISTAIGSGSYAIYLIGLALAFNAGTNGGYTIAYVCAIIGGIANSFLDTGIYPAVAEIIYKAPGVATMGNIKPIPLRRSVRSSGNDRVVRRQCKPPHTELLPAQSRKPFTAFIYQLAVLCSRTIVYKQPHTVALRE